MNDLPWAERMKIPTWIDNLILSIKYWLHICMEDGCWKRDTVSCFLPDYESQSVDGKPDYYYCSKHAGRFFCRICGQFWAGIESFDFLHPGYCDNCDDQIQHDFDDGEDDDYDFQSDYQYEDVP